MRILITNDDGIFAPGIRALYDVLSANHQVFVLAPEGQCSGFSHCISFDKRLSLTKVDDNQYSLNGTPCDCVKLAIDRLFKPDIVISGINAGRNSGTDVWYSGTVQAALEGVISGFPSMAVSSKPSDINDYTFAAHFIGDNLDSLYNAARSFNGVLNVNVPILTTHEYKGVKFVPLGRRVYHDSYIQVAENEYVMRGEHIDDDHSVENDLKCFDEGWITMTAVTIDPTDHDATGGLCL